MENKWVWCVRVNTGTENKEETGFGKTAGEAYLEAARKASLWLDSPFNSYNAINIHVGKRFIKDYVVDIKKWLKTSSVLGSRNEKEIEPQCSIFCGIINDEE